MKRRNNKKEREDNDVRKRIVAAVFLLVNATLLSNSLVFADTVLANVQTTETSTLSEDASRSSYGAIGEGSANIICLIIKIFEFRVCPQYDHSLSSPFGHTSNSSACRV